MIRSIPKITSFGIFDNFHWNTGIPEFKQYNLIYGWNYSGKTTLARVFRCFELKRMHEDFVGAHVQLKTDDGTVHHLSSPDTAPTFRVFNTDFIRDNFSFTNGSAEAILVLGAEDISKQGALDAKKSERETVSLSLAKNLEDKEDKSTGIEKELTRYARDLIKNPLAVPNYDKTRFAPIVSECKDAYEKYLLDDIALANCLTVYRSTDQKSTLSSIACSLASVAQLSEKTTALLARVVTATNPISRLKNNPLVETWVNQGRPLHEDERTCHFCGQALPADLMTHLTGHFSADYDNLMVELNALVTSITSHQKEDIALPHKADFYAELSEQFAIEKTKIDLLLRARNLALKSLVEALEAKLTKAFKSLECPKFDDLTEKIDDAVEVINKIIAEHNSRTAEFDKNRQEAFVKLEKHYAASFVQDQQYNGQLKGIAYLTTTIDEQTEKINELNAEIRSLELELSEASRGAERINELLATYFGKNDLRIVALANKRFQIVRSGVVAKNLSEGEKMAIAFAYFITRIQDGRHPLEDTRIVIDDPVSSLDANHLFNTYALIKTQLDGCCQLFILTHSFEFYNLFREWIKDKEKSIKKPQADWKHWSVFCIKRPDDDKAVLEEIPKELLKFKSEYHYLFSTIYHFDNGGEDDFDCLLSLPNVIRRFMEAFGGIMIPLSMGLKKKMERIFQDAVVRERVWKFINHYSHNNTITRSLTIPDISECKAVVQACLKAVEDWDAAYFKDLKSEVV